MKQIAIYGGAFDPPHIGHIAILKYLSKNMRYIDEIWMMPCYSHTFGKIMASSYRRLDMCRIASKGISKVKVCKFEINNMTNGSMYETLQKIIESEKQKKSPEIMFFTIAIGQDNAEEIEKWVNFKELMHLANFVVFKRNTKSEIKNPWYMHQGIFIEDARIPEISSTCIRNLFTNNNFDVASQYLDPDVFAYIQTHKLYA